MKKYNAKVTWLNIAEIIIGRLVLMAILSIGIILAIAGIQWFIEVFLAEHTIARIIFYIISITFITITLYKEFKE